MAQTEVTSQDFEENDGVLTGPFRAPTNMSKDAAGSIHDDATAQQLGFKGGTVAGNIHMEQFPPLLVQLYGDDWFRHGSLSLYFRSPTVDMQPVRCFADILKTNDVKQTRVWMEDEEGNLICEGTGGIVSGEAPTMLRSMLTKVSPSEDLRILGKANVGDTFGPIDTRVEAKAIDRRIGSITEALDIYKSGAKFGERVLPPVSVIDVMRVVEEPMIETSGPFVGLFGAIEFQFLDGPVCADTDYRARGEVLALTDSPKTESVWYESVLSDAKDDKPVASMLMMSRVLKNSSPLWTGEDSK